MSYANPNIKGKVGGGSGEKQGQDVRYLYSKNRIKGEKERK